MKTPDDLKNELDALHARLTARQEAQDENQPDRLLDLQFELFDIQDETEARWRQATQQKPANLSMLEQAERTMLKRLAIIVDRHRS